MTIGINEQPSLLHALLQESLGTNADNRGTGGTSAFAGTLDQALKNGAELPASAGNAQPLAEALRLQMLQTTLSLAGDTPADVLPLPQTGGKSLLQELARAYGAPQGETSPALPPTESLPHQKLSEPAPSEAVGRPSAAATAQQDSSWLDPVIDKASRRYGIDNGLIRAVIKAESNFNPNAVSHAGARGLMQLMPSTARSLGVSDSFDPEQNVMAGTRFLRDLLNRYNGDLDSALAAYNWGPGNVDRRPERMPRETRDYLARVKQLYNSYLS